MRADRLLSLLMLLRHRGLQPAATLAAELEVSSRTVLRDIEALSAAGVPVYAERGRYGGFALLSGWSTDLTGLTRPEAEALLTAGSFSGTGGGPDIGRALASALRKLTASMPAEHRQAAEHAAARILVVADGWVRRADPVPCLGIVQRAVLSSRRLQIHYTPRGRPTTRRTVEPHGLVNAGGDWYLLADHRGAERSYRMSRVSRARILDERIREDPTDLADRWERARAGFSRRRGGYHARVVVEPIARDQLVRTALAILDETTSETGFLDLTIEFGDRLHAQAVLWTLAGSATAIEPDELVRDLADRAARTVASYPVEASKASTAAAPPSPDTPPPR